MNKLISDNVRVSIEGDDEELRASMKEFGWVPKFPALADEHGVILVGHRRMKIAGELKIAPVIETVTLGKGEAADAERLKLAIVSNIGFKPMTKKDRQHIAKHLYGTHDWTMKRIGEALGVSTATAARDVGGISHDEKIKSPAKTAANPKGAGRPKNKGPKDKPVKFDNATRDKAASLVLDQGKTFDEAAAEVGVSSTVMRTAVAKELGRREIIADPIIDPATLSVSAREKLEAAIRQHKKGLDLKFEATCQQWLQDALKDTVLPQYNENKKRHDEIIKARKGIMTRAVFNSIRRCLHPDSRQSVSDEKLNEAFHLFSKMELLLLDEAQHPTPSFKMPTTYQELMEMKRKVAEQRKARRAGKANVSPRH